MIDLNTVYYWARLDSENNVIDLIKADVTFIKSGLVGEYSEWKPCARDGSISKNMPGLGYSYREDIDAFVPPKPYPSWVLDEDIAQWQAPTPKPTDGNPYQWDEATTSWVIGVES